MTSRSAESATAAAGGGWGEAAGRLTKGSRPESTVVVGVTGAVEGIVHCPSLTAETGIIIGSGRHSRAVETPVAGTGTGGSMGDPVAVSDGIKGPEIGIDGCGSSMAYNEYAAAIVRIVEVGIVPAVPQEVAVPGHVGVPETKAISKAKSPHSITVSEAIAKTIGGIAESVTNGCAYRCIIGVISAVVVELRPAGAILCFHAYIVIAGRGAVIVTLVGTAGSGCFLTTGRVVDIIGALGVA